MKRYFARMVDQLLILVYVCRSEVDDDVDYEYDVHTSVNDAQEVKAEQELVEKHERTCMVCLSRLHVDHLFVEELVMCEVVVNALGFFVALVVLV